MTARVVGIEGAWPEDGPVLAWGAAVVKLDGRIVNSLSGQSSAEADLANLAQAGHIAPLPALNLPTGVSVDGLVLVALHSGEVSKLFRPDTGVVKTIAKSVRKNGVSLYVFRDTIDFHRYADDRIASVGCDLLTSSLDSPNTRAVVRAMLTLNARDPLALAIEAHFDPSFADFARDILVEDDHDAFDATLDSLRGEPTSRGLRIKYSGGIASGRGLGTRASIRQLRAVHKAVGLLDPAAKNVLRFMPDKWKSPDPQFQRLEAASAEMEFGYVVDGDDQLTRVGRLTGLRLLRRAMMGEVPSNIRDVPAFTKCMSTLRRPSEDTRTSVSIGDDDYSEVDDSDDIDDTETPDHEVTLLAFAIGCMDHTRKLELALSVRWDEVVSTLPVGEATAAPAGVDRLTAQSGWLWSPCIVRLRRYRKTGGAITSYLQHVQWMDDGTSGAIDGVPSAIVPGAIFRRDMEVVRVGERLRVGDIELTSGGSEPKVIRSLETLMESTRVWEMNAGDGGDWTPPANYLRPTAVERILYALHPFESPLTAQQISRRIFELFEVNVRINNTSRDAVNSELFVANKSIAPAIRPVVASEEGRRYFAVHSKANPDRRSLRRSRWNQ